jgi:hypothetical protein
MRGETIRWRWGERTVLGLGSSLPPTPSRGLGRLPPSWPGSQGNKTRVGRAGRLRGRAALWDSFPQLPTCTQPNRGPARPGLQVPEFREPALPLRTGDWSQTLKETPKALSPHAGERSRHPGAALGLRPGPLLGNRVSRHQPPHLMARN